MSKKKALKRWYKNIELLWDNCPEAHKDIEDEWGVLRIRKTDEGFLLSRSILSGEFRIFTNPISVTKQPT